MTWLGKTWRSWVRLFDDREPGLGLALFRILIGAVLVFTLLWMWWRGVPEVIWLDVSDGGYRRLTRGTWLFRKLGGYTPTLMWTFFAIATGSAFALMVGAGGRVTAFVLLQSYMALHRFNGAASGSSDVLITNALWLLVLANATSTWSVDCRLRTGRFADDTARVPAWPRYLIIMLQLLVMYCSTGLQKVSAHWTPVGGFSALYYILQQPTWARADIPVSFWGWTYPVLQLSTALVWVFEIGAPALLLVYWFRTTSDRPGRLRRWCNRFDLRWPFTVFGLGMHLLIGMLMVVGPFSPISMCFYVCLWTPDELRRAGGVVVARLRRRGSGDM